MKKQDEIEDLFASNFGDFERMPPMEIKNSIDEQLFDQGKVSSKRGFFWILSILGLIGFVTVLTYHTDFRREEIPLASSNANTVLRENISIETSSHTLKTNNNPVKSLKQPKGELKQERQVFQNQSKTDAYSVSRGPRIKGSDFQENSDYNKDKASFVNESKIKDYKNNEQSPTFIIEENTEKKKITEDDKSSISVLLKEDSINTLEELVTTAGVNSDSTKKEESIESHTPGNTADLKAKDKSSQWSLSFYSGTSIGMNRLEFKENGSFDVKEKLGFSSSLEVNYQIAPRFGVSSGFDLRTHKETFSGYAVKSDSVLVITEEYIYDQNGDSIVDTIYHTNYQNTETQVTQNLDLKHFSFALPLYFSVNALTKGNWDLDIKGGLRFSYMKNEVTSSYTGLLESKKKQFGLNATLRPQLVYSFKNYRIGTYFSANYDITPITHIKLSDAYFLPTSDRSLYRKRIELEFGVLVRYQF